MTIDDPRQNAGWYPDPEGSTGERWWNGSQWTSHTRDAQWTSEFPGLEGQSPKAWSASDYPLATVSPETPTGTAMFPPAPAKRVPAPPMPLAVEPGWYPDPQGLPAQRWWDGMAWTDYSGPSARPGYPAQNTQSGYPQFNAPPGGSTVVVIPPSKSVGVAFFLTFIFGPLGMLYSTVSGGLIMLAVWIFGGIMVSIATFGVGLFIWWPMVWVASIVWGCLAADKKPPVRVVNTYR